MTNDRVNYTTLIIKHLKKQASLIHKRDNPPLTGKPHKTWAIREITDDRSVSKAGLRENGGRFKPECFVYFDYAYAVCLKELFRP